MSKTANSFFIMRHAESDHPIGMRDFDRPLSIKGEHQPEKVAKRLKKHEVIIDHALVSPALRTRQTFEILKAHLAHPPVPFFEERLYNAPIDDVLQVLGEYEFSNKNCLLIGHNPSVSMLCSFLTGMDCDFGTAHLAILRPKNNFLFEKNSFILERMLTP